MTKIIHGLRDVVQNYDAVFCDVWGVLHNGQKAYADAVEALMQARMLGCFVGLVTNSPKTPSWVAAQIARLGAPDTCYDEIITAGQAMQYSLFSTRFKRFYFIGSEDDRVVLTDLPQGVVNKMEETTDYKAADVIICAGPDYGHKNSPEDYDIELRQLATRRLEMYCGNPDVIVDHGDKRIYCAGAIAKAYEDLGGTVYQFGKPFPPIYQLARNEMLNARHGDMGKGVLFIGDGIMTDLKGAMLEDMDALFVSGGLAAKETKTSEGEPDAAALNAYLAEHEVDPRYTIGKLRW